MNFPIQSLAADVIKVAMINIHKTLNMEHGASAPSSSPPKVGGDKGGYDCKMLLQVHDELVFEVKEDKVEHYAKMLKPLMEEAIKLSVPVKVEAKVGDNWGEMESIEV